MFRFTHHASYTSYFYAYLITTGIGLIVFGIIFIIWPELLAYLVSFFFILLGLMSLALAVRIRSVEKIVRKKVSGLTDSVKAGLHDIRDLWEE